MNLFKFNENQGNENNAMQLKMWGASYQNSGKPFKI
jgi:hypothetical protein